jgi:multiple sugar transport system ATP-binding protein
MAEIEFERVHKLFGSACAVDDLSLRVRDGEFLVLVGPSGCGKTTSLRMLAGFERPTYGTVSIAGSVVNRVPPRERDLAMVFQSYALFPHMTVFRNLAFGMRIRRAKREEVRRRVHEVAATLELDGLLERRPAELSGGQRQRVALGRALLREPQAFLMDEPLSNLDAALRVQMRVELGRLHERLGVTTVYVTHDQVEAMTMGGRIAVMSGGRLQQCDAPEQIYARPTNLFVAGFIGSPKMNFFPGRIGSDDGRPQLHCLGVRLPLTGAVGEVVRHHGGDDLVVGLRPEDLRWANDAPSSCTVSLTGEVEVVEPLGSETYVVVSVAGHSLTARFPSRSGVKPSARVALALDPTHVHVFDRRTERNLLTTTAEYTDAAATLSAAERRTG